MHGLLSLSSSLAWRQGAQGTWVRCGGDLQRANTLESSSSSSQLRSTPPVALLPVEQYRLSVTQFASSVVYRLGVNTVIMKGTDVNVAGVVASQLSISRGARVDERGNDLPTFSTGYRPQPTRCRRETWALRSLQPVECVFELQHSAGAGDRLRKARRKATTFVIQVAKLDFPIDGRRGRKAPKSMYRRLISSPGRQNCK